MHLPFPFSSKFIHPDDYERLNIKLKKLLTLNDYAVFVYSVLKALTFDIKSCGGF